MREKITIYFAALVMVLFIPYLVTVLIAGTTKRDTASLDLVNSGKVIRVEQEGEYQVYDLEEYLVGILAAQISPDYQLETIKAQAVIARTCLYKETEGYEQADAAALTQTYLTEEERKELWGEKRYDEYNKIMEQAVLDTLGQTIRYEGAYIDAMYHSVSIGRTVSALELCGNDVPYLQAVDSPQDVEAKDYMQVLLLTPEELGEKFGVTLTMDNAAQALCVTQSTENGYVTELQVGEGSCTGEEAAKILGITSTNFYIEALPESGTVRIVVLGKGHGMGLSQYGANCLAKAGKTYDEILKYYYTGVTVGE